MSLLTSIDLLTMDFSYGGEPFVSVPVVSQIDTFTMDYPYAGEPFVTNPNLAGPANIGGWDGVGSANLQSLMGTQYTSIETINGVT